MENHPEAIDFRAEPRPRPPRNPIGLPGNAVLAPLAYLSDREQQVPRRPTGNLGVQPSEIHARTDANAPGDAAQVVAPEVEGPVFFQGSHPEPAPRTSPAPVEGRPRYPCRRYRRQRCQVHPFPPPVRALRGGRGALRGAEVRPDRVARVPERGDVGEHAALAHAPRHRQRHAVPFQGPSRRRVPGGICPVSGEQGAVWRPERRPQRRRRGVKGAAGLGNSPIEIVTPPGEGSRGGSERSPGDLRGGTPGGEPPPDVKRGDPAVADLLAGVNSRPRTGQQTLQRRALRSIGEGNGAFCGKGMPPAGL